MPTLKKDDAMNLVDDFREYLVTQRKFESDQAESMKAQEQWIIHHHATQLLDVIISKYDMSMDRLETALKEIQFHDCTKWPRDHLGTIVRVLEVLNGNASFPMCERCNNAPRLDGSSYCVNCNTYNESLPIRDQEGNVW